MDRNHLYASSGVDFAVALRKESVDRNKIRIAPIDSVSSVALRKESVDRNGAKADSVTKWTGRSPQGERG